MQQHLIKLRHHIKTGKVVKKLPIVALCTAANYTDAEVTAAKLIESETFNVSGDVIVTKLAQNHEILGYKEDESKNWYKSKLRYMSESDKGKTTTFYVRYFVYADDINKALAIILEKEKSSAFQGEIMDIALTTIDYMLIPKAEFAIS